jgi:prepilin-type N-terminal cleavage/methylation domain-containing protein
VHVNRQKQDDEKQYARPRRARQEYLVTRHGKARYWYRGGNASALLWTMLRRGHTLIELAMVLALLGILLGLAAPRLLGALDGVHAGQAAARIALAHGRARAAALNEQRRRGERCAALVGDSLRWQLPGPAMDGAGLLSEPEETSYAPNGLAMGAANARYIVTRGMARVEIFVSRLGRVRIVRSGV